MPIKETLESLRPLVFSTLNQKKLPKGYAKKLSCSFVVWMCDVKCYTRSQFKSQKKLDELRSGYKVILKILKEVNK